MNKLYTLFWAKALFLIFITSSIAQVSSYVPQPAHPDWFKAIPAIDSDTPDWAVTMYEDDTNFIEIERKKRNYYKTNPYKKTIHIQNYKYWFKIVSEYVNDQGIVELPKDKEIFEKSLKSKSQNNKMVANWTNIGPYETVNFTNGVAEQRPTQANIFCLAVAPSNTSIVYASAETGGVYKTTDKGLNWIPVSEGYSLGSFRDLKVHPTNPDIVFGTRNDILFYTDDGGSTWIIRYDFTGIIEQLYINPVTPGIMYAACDNGVYKSTDSGLTWTQKRAGRLYDIEAKPGTPSTLYIAVENTTINRPEIFRSTDSGDTWTLMDNGYYAGSTQSVATVFGCKIGVTPADPDRIYSGIIATGKDGDNGWIGVYYSLDNGATWQDDSGFDGGPYAEGSDAATNWYVAGYSSGYHQGFYNFDLDVSHTNADKIWIGTIWFSESGNRGGNIEYIRGTRNLNMHADIQDIDVVGGEIWIASDGGINYSNDECLTVSTRMKGIYAADYWGFGMGWNEDTWVGGRYHNGNAAFHENYGAGKTVFLGGAENATGYVNQLQNKKSYYSDVGAKEIPEMYNSDAANIPNLGLYPTESYFHFNYSEVEWHPYYNNIVYVGKDNQLQKSIDAGTSFEPIFTFPEQVSGDDPAIRRFEISRDDPNYIYAIVYQSYWDWRIYRSTDGGDTFTVLPKPNYTSGSWRNLSMTLNPFDKNELWIASNSSSNGNKIFSSLNGGQSWTNRYSSTIADEGIKDLIYQASDDGDLVYAMTNDNFYYYSKNTNSWNQWNVGLPVAHKGFMTLPFYRDNKVRMASAKGIWESPMEHTSKIQAFPKTNVDSIFCARDTIQLESYSIVAHTGTTWTWTISPAPSYISDANARNPKVVLGVNGNYDVTLSITDANNKSDTRTVNNMLFLDNRCGIDSVAGNSLKTEENGDYLLVSDVNLSGITEFTITGWWKPIGAQEPYAAIVSSGDWCAHCDDTEGLIFDYYGSKLWYKWPGMADNWGSNSGIDIPLNEWSYVALTITPQGATMYLNDEKYFHSKALNPAEISALYIGYGHYSKSFKGEIDEVSLWTRALSDDEIYSMRHLTKEVQAENDPALFAYYQFNTLFRDNAILDNAGVYHGALSGANTTIVSSSVPVGKGKSDLIVLDENIQSYSGINSQTDIVLSTCENVSGKLVMSHIEVPPSADPGESTENVDEYWVLNGYELTTFPTIDSVRLTPKGMTFLQNNPSSSDIISYIRNENDGDTRWELHGQAANILSNSVIFDRTSQLSKAVQFTFGNNGDGLDFVDPGSPCEADTIPGKSINLPGTSGSYAIIPPLDITTNTISFSAWVKPDGIQNSWAGILFARGGSTTSGLSCASNNELRYHWNGGEYSWSSGAYLPVDVWSHIAMVISPTQVVIYLNGEPHTRNVNHSPEEFTAEMRVGNDASSGSRTFQGEIDEVTIWNRSLTIDEIRELRHLTKEKEVLADNDLIVYLQFNEEEGKIYDRSGSNLHASLQGSSARNNSSAPVGGGISEKLTINSVGTYSSITGVDLTFDASGNNPNGDVFFSRINLSPDVVPTDDSHSQSYWVINNYGNNTNLSGLSELTFHNIGNTTPDTDANALSLHRRVDNGEGLSWINLYSGDVYAANTGSITFDNNNILKTTGQFVISNASAKSWIGVTNHDWTNATNWNGGIIPTSTDNVVIPADVPFYPILNANVIIKSLNLMPGAILKIPEIYSFSF